MRLSPHQVDILAFEIARELRETEAIRIPEKEIPRLEEHLRSVITAELRIEDDLNEEVHRMLQPYLQEMKAADASYTEMFKKLRAKLARERKIIL